MCIAYCVILLLRNTQYSLDGLFLVTPNPDRLDALDRRHDDVTATLQAIARSHQLTMHTLVQGAWALTLSRYSGQRDVLFGETEAVRPAAIDGVESMVGVVTNTLPVRIQVPQERTVLCWLHDLQHHYLDQREYAFTPLKSQGLSRRRRRGNWRRFPDCVSCAWRDTIYKPIGTCRESHRR